MKNSTLRAKKEFSKEHRIGQRVHRNTGQTEVRLLWDKSIFSQFEEGYVIFLRSLELTHIQLVAWELISRSNVFFFLIFIFICCLWFSLLMYQVVSEFICMLVKNMQLTLIKELYYRCVQARSKIFDIRRGHSPGQYYCQNF